MKKYSNKDAKEFADKFGLNMKNELFKLRDITNGLNVEVEHGTVNKDTNVTNDDLFKTGKIALAHLRERPDYYDRLKKVEEGGEKKTKNNKKTKSK